MLQSSQINQEASAFMSAIPAKKMYEPQNGVTEGSPGEGSPGRGNAPLGKKGTADIKAFYVWTAGPQNGSSRVKHS